MLTTSPWIHRSLTVAVSAACLAIAPAALAQDEGAGSGEEEDFYRATDPEEPVAGAKPQGYGPRPGAIIARGGVYRAASYNSDLEDSSTRPFIQVAATYSVLDPGYWLGLRVGIEFGGIPLHAYDVGSITEQQFAQVRSDIETGITGTPNSHPSYSVGIDVATVYGAAYVELDLASSGTWDTGPMLAAGYGQSEIDTIWFCVMPNCTGGTLERESASESISHAVLRFGWYLTYRLPWFEERFRIGLSAGMIYFATSDLPANSGLDLALLLEFRF